MLSVYKISIESAIIIFPLVAFLLTLPFLIYHYRKYGAIPLLRSIIFYSLILYLITAYFLVILPLPDKEAVKKLTSPVVQLIPFKFVNDIIKSMPSKVENIYDIVNLLTLPTIYTNLFNLFLTLPLGIYLRYYFNKKWYQVINYSFLLSLFFEFTQLSGLYGIYPRAYRLFDVDDLIINTLGGLLGYFVTPIFMLILPSRQELDEISYKKGQRVTLLRRIIAFFIDLFLLSILSLIIKILSYNHQLENWSIIIAVTIYYFIQPLLTGGKTFGKKVMKLKISSITKKDSIKWYQLLIRNFFLTYLTLYPMITVSILKKYINQDYIILIIELLIIVYQIINIIAYISTKTKNEHLFLYEKLTNTKNISTITINKEILNIHNNVELETKQLELQRLEKPEQQPSNVESNVQTEVELKNKKT